MMGRLVFAIVIAVIFAAIFVLGGEAIYGPWGVVYGEIAGLIVAVPLGLALGVWVVRGLTLGESE